MSCNQHDGHSHEHGSDCGHVSIEHDGHTDYLHDGHMHHSHGDHVDEHSISVNNSNKNECTPEHKCSSHEDNHVHGPDCGHEMVPHGDHKDYLVSGHLHHSHNGHCDDHGPVKVS